MGLSQLGVREHGFNAGPDVEKYIRLVGSPPHSAWCSCFVCWVLRKAGVITALFGRACDWFDAAHTIWRGGHQVAGRPPPRPGDLLGYTWGADHICHVELLIGEWGSGPAVKALGGNTGGGRALLREGDGVFVNWRLKRMVAAVADPIDNPHYRKPCATCPSY